MHLLGGHFECSCSTVLERNTSRRRYQLPGERIAEYVAGVGTLSISCCFRDQFDKDLTDQFLNGVPSHWLRERLFTEGKELNFMKAVDIALHLE